MPVDVRIVRIWVDLGAKEFRIEGTNDISEATVECRHEGGAAPQDVALFKAFLRSLEQAYPGQNNVPC